MKAICQRLGFQKVDRRAERNRRVFIRCSEPAIVRRKQRIVSLQLAAACLPSAQWRVNSESGIAFAVAI